MKIGIIKHRYVPEGGGSERYTIGLVSELLRRGHEVHILSGVTDKPGIGTSAIVHRVPIIPGPSFVRQVSFARSCLKMVARVRCDVFFSLERTVRQDIARAGGGCHREYLKQYYRFFGPRKRVLLALNPLHRTLLYLEKRTFDPRNTRVVIANSNRGEEEIIAHYHFPAERIEVIHNGTDCERFKPVPRSSGEATTLLFVGSGFERKGLSFVIKALPLLPKDVRLVVAGKGSVTAHMRIANKLQVANRIEFLGVQHRIEDVYARGDILVHPAIYEPFSNACLEAMACGLPVVTSAINGAAEVIRAGESGAVVDDPSDSEALAESIALFLDPKRLGQARVSARQTAEKLPMSLNVKRTMEVIEAVPRMRT